MEISRIDVTKEIKRAYQIDVKCPKCGNEFQLCWNFRELDGESCCGLDFELEATGYQLVIYQEDN